MHLGLVFLLFASSTVVAEHSADSVRLANIRKRYAAELSVLAEYRKTPNHYRGSNGGKVLQATRKFFSEVDFIGMSRFGLEALLGSPDVDHPLIANSTGYSYGDGEEFVLPQFRFDSERRVKSVSSGRASEQGPPVLPP
jgi:hypothetical protein